ncbi:MAG: hypothetical protein RLZZ568_2089, partial [Cyanobacteriota bacterium]
DSELEKNFIEAIRKYRFKPGTLTNQHDGETVFPILRQEIFDGQTGYLLQIGAQKWRIATQVDLNETDNISISSKADFVFYPLGRNTSSLKPIVVFTDGWEYHQDRLGLDFDQRLAILRSQNYYCWSCTWDDVNPHYQEDIAIPPLPINALTQNFNERYLKAPTKIYDQYQCRTLSGLENQDSFVWLMQYLAEPDPELWQKWALFRTAIQADLDSVKESSKQTDWTRQVQEIIGEEALSEWDVSPPRFTQIIHVSPELRLYQSGDLNRHQQRQNSASFVTIHLQSEAPDSSSQSLKHSWREALRLLNLYQFLDYAYWLYDRNSLSPDFIIKAPRENIQAWEDIKPLIMDQAVLMVLPQLMTKNVPVPEPGYELEDPSGGIAAIAELAWINCQVALTTTAEDHNSFLAQGWHSWRCQDFFDQLPAILPRLQE